MLETEETTPEQLADIPDKCKTCGNSQHRGRACDGKPTFNNTSKDARGKKTIPLRCDQSPRQEEGPYL